MPNMEQIKCTGNVYNLVCRFWGFAVAELNDLLRRWKELGAPGPRATRRVVLSEFGRACDGFIFGLNLLDNGVYSFKICYGLLVAIGNNALDWNSEKWIKQEVRIFLYSK